MDNPHREVVETGTGIGMLYEGQEFIGEVNYRYKITQEYDRGLTKVGTKIIPGFHNLHGTFSTNSLLDLLGKELRLITANKRELSIYVMTGDPVIKIYIFVFGQAHQIFEIT